MYTEVYRIEMTFVEPLLGSAPRNKEVYGDFIGKKQREAVERETGEKEAENVADREERGWTGFLREPEVEGGPRTRLFLYDYTVKGFLKEASAANRETGEYDIGGAVVIKRKIGQHIWPEPRRIFLLAPEDHPGGPVAKGGCGHGAEGSRCSYVHVEDDVLERPLRAETAQGPRVTLARSDVARAGTRIAFDLRTLWPGGLGEKFLRACLDRGVYCGYGQWRTAGWGRFTYTLVTKGTSGVRPAPKVEKAPKKIVPKKTATPDAE